MEWTNFFIGLAVLFIGFLACRKIMCWYFKLSSIDETLKELLIVIKEG